MRNRRNRTFAVTALVLASICSASAASAQDRVTAPDDVRVNFDSFTLPDGAPFPGIVVTGTANVNADIAKRGGGEIRGATSRPGHLRAARLPTFAPASTGPRAVISITPNSNQDHLSPGKQNFSFGADFVLDETSYQAETSDNGDNLIQRGLFNDAAQYKLELDRKKPACRVLGTIDGVAAEVSVVSNQAVDHLHWYSASCIRDENTLTVVLTRYNADGTSDTWSKSAASTGTIKVTMAPTSIPLSIGGKLNPSGTVPSDADQFNGLVDEAFLNID